MKSCNTITEAISFYLNCAFIIRMKDFGNVSAEQKQYIEIKSGAGMATTCRSICEQCDMGLHNECSTPYLCYCAKNSHRML